jgi:tripartite-type tricarboxylate transporter receptor subunit TctC
MYFLIGLLISLQIFSTLPVSGQTYPNKPITLYCGYDAGGIADLSARGLAEGVSKILGVPVVVENKPGGAATVCCSLVASKKPDGYTLGQSSEGAITVRTHILKLPYTLEDFTPLCAYCGESPALCVLNESPIKTIEEFIAYAKEHPGLFYSTSGMYSTSNISAEMFAKCKGLKFNHVPSKGGSEANLMLMRKNVDFMMGGGSQMTYVRQGLFRPLLMVMGGTNKRHPQYPDVPVMGDIGCSNVPSERRMIFGPRGIPEAIVKKLSAAFRKASEEPKFQKLLKDWDSEYVYEEGKKFENELRSMNKWYGDYFKSIGLKK